MSCIVFLDTETTGLNPEYEDVFEVAAIGASSGLEFVFRIQPRTGFVRQMHPEAAVVNRYHERTAAAGWEWDDPDDALAAIYDLLDGAHICGAVPDFDARHLTALYRRFGEAPPRWHYHLIDIEAMAVGWLHGVDHAVGRLTGPGADEPEYDSMGPEFRVPMPGLPWRSDDLSRACGVEPPGEDERHTALGDARWCKRLYEAITGDPS